MKKIFTILMGNGLIATFSIVACFLAVTSTNAAPLISARITQIIQDVKLLPSNAAPRPAAVNDDVHQGTAVRTGQDSRTELTFTDKTLTRLGANSVFSFDSGASVFSLGQGSILMQVPPNGSSVKVKTAAVTAAITGGTAIFGTGPPVKFMVLEGTGTFYPNGHPEETMTLHGGEMVTFTADGHMIGPTTFNVKLVMESSELIVPFDELANLPLIYDVISQQQGTGPQIAFNDQTQTFDETDQAQNALPTPAPSESPGPTGTPSKFGAPSTISSPNPYVITSGTQIQTDPSITTNGVTDFGKIYRGPALDGSEYDYLFGSTSSFDSTIGTFFNTNGNGVPVAVFKFSSLQLTGNPTINIPTGSPTFLGLVSVGDVTSGAPGGTLSFAGLDRLFIATQNGSINLGPEIAFSGIGHVVFYARGSGSNLTLGSEISGAAVVHLFAEGTVQVNGDITTSSDFKSFSGGDFLAGSGVITADSIDIESLANVNIDGATLTSETLNISGAGDVNIGQGESSTTLNAISISLSAQHDLNWSGQTSNETATNSDGNVNISAGNAINILTDLDIERTNGGRTSGLNITLNAGTALTVGGNLSLSTDASNIQNGGNITVTSGENTTIGGSFILHTVGLAGTATGTGGNIAVNTGGNLLAGNLDFTVDYNTPDVSVNNGANLTLNVGGNLTTTQGGVDMIIYTPIAGPLTNGGNLSLSVGGDLNTAKGGNVNLTVVNTISTSVPTGANLFASIGGDLNANAVNAQIENDSSGGIGTGGNLTFNVSGDLNASSLLVQLSNTAGGHIANGGDITFHVGGDLTVAGDANFLLLNGGGTIGGNVAVTLSAVNVSANSLTAEIDNNGGVIGSSATINSNISGNANVTNDVTLEILGSSETTPAEAININGGTYDVGGTFLATIDGDGAITLNNANIRADTIKITAFGANGTLNIGGGTIAADTMLKLYAAGSNGSINFVANVTLNSQSTATLIQAVSVTIFNGVIVTIAGPAPAEVFTDHPNYSSTDTSGNPTGGNDNTTGKFAGSGANTTGFSGPTPTPSGTPSKFGPPTTIASPVPYLITSNTVIQTDPAITTNGVTDYGKIWRGADTDGPLSAFIFGSTSSFDTSSAFDIILGGGGQGGAGFKFTTLQLTGDPTVSTTNGEINLGLIAVNGITSGAPGGVLTFAGIRGLLLATQNGPITLGPEISFSGLHDINIYARGSSSDLTLGSDISTSSRVVLLAERDMSITSSLTTEFVYAFAGRNIAFLDPAIMHAETIMLSAGQDLTWNGQTSDVTVLNSVGNVDIVAGNQISIINALEIDRRFGGGQSSGLIVSFAAGTDLTAGNGLTILIDNSGEGNMDSGVNARLDIGGNLTINGAGGLSLTIDNSNFGHIGTGGNITVTTGGNLTAGSIDAFINNRNGGSIDSGGNLMFDIGGALTTQGDANFSIENRFGGNIGSNATINVSAANISIGGSLSFRNNNDAGDPTVGGMIGTDATINVNAGSISVTGDLTADIPNGLGIIGGNAIINFDVSGDITTQGSASFQIRNDSSGGSGGTIGSEALINVSAVNISTVGHLQLLLGNNLPNASLGGAGLSLQASGTITTGDFLEGFIFNDGGHIGTGGDITVHVAGDMNVGASAFFGISNVGGTIDSNPVVDIRANNISTGGFFEAYIDNTNGSIGPEGNGGSVTLHADGTITVGAALDVWGAVTAGGDINAQTISSTNVTSFGNISAGSGGIREFQFPSGVFATSILHTLTAASVTSQGGINFDGVAADGDFSMATNAGALTINADSLSFGSAALRVSGFIPPPPSDIVGFVTFNGGDGSSTFDPGNGGTFTVNTTSDITVNSDIEATSGRIQPGASPSGDGGEVNLNSSNGTVTVNNRIQVSSAEPSSTISPVRQSAKGGKIGITSAKTTGVAINIGSSAQLLSLLNAAAPGPGGSIKIVASKAGSNGTNSSSININNANGDPGAIVADRGTVEIRHDGDSGAININNANIRADVVKVGALGLNGTLNIGGGSISADTILKLYATGSNGQLNFISDVTLSSGTAMHLAANTITIQPSIIVTINGTGGAANVYTNHPNYSGFGGTTPTNGTFAGNGAHNPQPLGNAPGF